MCLKAATPLRAQAQMRHSCGDVSQGAPRACSASSGHRSQVWQSTPSSPTNASAAAQRAAWGGSPYGNEKYPPPPGSRCFCGHPGMGAGWWIFLPPPAPALSTSWPQKQRLPGGGGYLSFPYASVSWLSSCTTTFTRWSFVSKLMPHTNSVRQCGQVTCEKPTFAKGFKGFEDAITSVGARRERGCEWQSTSRKACAELPEPKWLRSWMMF